MIKIALLCKEDMTSCLYKQRLDKRIMADKLEKEIELTYYVPSCLDGNIKDSDIVYIVPTLKNFTEFFDILTALNIPYKVLNTKSFNLMDTDIIIHDEFVSQRKVK